MMHAEFRDLAALDSVGAATSAQREKLRAHLSECSECRTAEREYQQAASPIPGELDPLDPPAEVRERILIAADEEDLEDLPVDEPGSRRGGAWWLGAAAVFFLALFGWNELRVRELQERVAALQASANQLDEAGAQLSRENSALAEQIETLAAPTVHSTELKGQGIALSASGRVYFEPASAKALVFLDGLPANDATSSYQLWVMGPDDAAASVAVFEVSERGAASVQVRRLPSSEGMRSFRVTLEPKGGSSEPTGETVLLGSN